MQGLIQAVDVVPAQAGTQSSSLGDDDQPRSQAPELDDDALTQRGALRVPQVTDWIPDCAGMTMALNSNEAPWFFHANPRQE